MTANGASLSGRSRPLIVVQALDPRSQLPIGSFSRRLASATSRERLGLVESELVAFENKPRKSTEQRGKYFGHIAVMEARQSVVRRKHQIYNDPMISSNQ